MKKKHGLKMAFLIPALLALNACDRTDGYAEKFMRVEIGDTKARAVEIMGEPTSQNRVETPLVAIEDLAWRSRVSGRVYMIHTILNRVVTKSVID